MSKFNWTRRPNFGACGGLNPDAYWAARGFEIANKLKPREEIMAVWVAPSSDVLDLGCGNSRLPLRLKEKGCTVTVGDISKMVLEGYRQSGLPTINLDLERVESWPYLGIHDYVILSEVLEHTRNPEEILSRLKNHAKKIIITIPNSAFYRYRLHLFWHGRFFTQWVHHPSEHLRFWSHTDFLDWLEALGFKVLTVKASNGPAWLKDFWPNLFSHQMCYLIHNK